MEVCLLLPWEMERLVFLMQLVQNSASLRLADVKLLLNKVMFHSYLVLPLSMEMTGFISSLFNCPNT